MGFLKRLLSIGGKPKRNEKSKKHTASSSSTQLLPIPQDQEVVVNRLLRSSSTHFSILSETEYRSLPPIPHPINNVLRAPSIMSTSTQTDTYKVTIHRRMLHSCTEFPNANGIDSRSAANSPARRHSSLLPPSPGDRNRLSILRQDASVLSLLNILDDAGCPNPESFSNTPSRRDRNDPSLRVLMGNPSPPSLTTSKTSAEESDISWADRHIRTARRDSTCSSMTTSSLGIPVDLFKSSISPDRLRFDHSDSASSRNFDIGIDSLQVERGTAEDASMINCAPVLGLTSPSRRASQFFKFLSDGEGPQTINCSLDQPSTTGASPTACKTFTHADVDDKITSSSIDIPVLFVREGPKAGRAQVSPPPRRRRAPTRDLPAVPTPDPSPDAARPRAKHGHAPLGPAGQRAPFDALHNAAATAAARRSVSIASSVHPQIETHNAPGAEAEAEGDPYTPVPARGAAEGRRRDGHGAGGENVPPNAPARPVRGQTRRQMRVPRECAKPVCGREHDASQLAPVEPVNRTSAKPSVNEKPPRVTARATPPATPAKNPALSQLQTPARPSPASSSELSPEGREIMASARAKARKPSQSRMPRPRAWQPWSGASDGDP